MSPNWQFLLADKLKLGHQVSEVAMFHYLVVLIQQSAFFTFIEGILLKPLFQSYRPFFFYFILPLLLLLLLSRFSHDWLCVTVWTAAHHVPLSTGFSRQEYCSRLPFPSPILPLNQTNYKENYHLPYDNLRRLNFGVRAIIWFHH